MLNQPPLQRDGHAQSKSCIIEQHNLTDQAYQLASSVPEDEPLFQPLPQEIIFSDYEPFKKYTAMLQLRNNDKAMRRVQVLTVDPETVTVHQPYDQGNEIYVDMGTNKVACGMKVTYIVTFCPESDEDYQSELVIVTDREKFIVPVKCYGRRSLLIVPDEVVFPPTPVKCLSKKNFMIQNVGSKACTFNITTTGAFSVAPTDGHIEKGCLFVCELTFQPFEAKLFEEELKIFYSKCDQSIITRVTGEGCQLDIGLSVGHVSLPITFIGKSASANVQLINESSSVVQFFWTNFYGGRDRKQKINDNNPFDDQGDIQVQSRDKTEEGCFETMSEAFSISPSNGDLWPGGILDLKITFSPSQALRYMHTGHCIVTGRSNPLKLEMHGVGIGPQVQFIPEIHDLGNIYLYSTYKFTVELRNTGELEAVYRLMNPRRSGIINFTFHPSSGTLPSREVEIIHVEAVCVAMGEFREKFLWEVNGVLQNLSLVFLGLIGAPEFYLNTKKVNFGNVSYGIECVSQIEVKNASPLPLVFSFQIDKEESDPSNYSTNPSSYLLQSNEIKTVDLCVTAKEEKKIYSELLLSIDGVGNGLVSIQLEAECFSPEVSLSLGTLDYGECFLGYQYTQEIELINSSNVAARYEFVSLSPEDQTSAIIEADAVSGIIPCYSQKPMKLSLQTQCLGPISLVATVNISGKEPKSLSCTILASSCGPSIRIEQSNVDGLGSLDQSGDLNPILEFGKVEVLKTHNRILVIKNVSCIPAEVGICLTKRKTVFHVERDGFMLEPFGSEKLDVSATLDDCVKFTDTLKVTTEGSEHLVTLRAVGIGSTIVCKELENMHFDFGKQVTLRTFSHTFSIENQGRKQLPVSWVSMNTFDGPTKGNLTEEVSFSLQRVHKKKVFLISPEKTIIKSHSSCLFTLTGYALDPDCVVEELRCNVTTSKGVWSYKLTVKADISPLKLLLSSNELLFVQKSETSCDIENLKQILTCKNVSELPLDFEMSTKEPFSLSHSVCTLQPSESLNIEVGFQRQYCDERLSKVIQGSLLIDYKGTDETEALRLRADVCYPNLLFDTMHLNFGTVIENTVKRLQLSIQNTSDLPANYHWFLVNDASRNSNERIDIRHIFDILPICGCLQPGEKEKLEFTFYSYPGYQCQAKAICEVEGGPSYTVTLEAEAGLIKYSISDANLDFGLQQFNETAEKHFCLINSGSIGINFSVILSCLRGTPVIKVSPLLGNIDPGCTQSFTVSICPVLPEKYEANISIQVSYFLPHDITVFGEGVFPSISVDLPRIRNHQFLLIANEALKSLKSNRPKNANCDNLLKEKENNLTDLKESSETLPLLSEPTLEEIDAEINRLLLIQHLMPVDNSDYSCQQNKLMDDFSDREHIMEKKLQKMEKMILSRYLCDFGNVILGESCQKSICIRNIGVLPVSLKADKAYVKGTGFYFEPDKQLKLPVTSNVKTTEINVILKTDSPKFNPGVIEASIPLCVKEAPSTLVMLKAHVTTPLLEVSTEYLDFDSVLLGHCKSIFLRLHNAGTVPCKWEIMKPDSNISDFASIRDFSVFSCIPSSGTMSPNDCLNMEVRFMPIHKNRSYVVKLPMKVLHSSGLRYLSCKGQSYSLPFSIEPTEVQLRPIIPKETPPAQCNFDLINNSDQLIEVYSVDYDTQYIEEDNILQEVKTFDEEGLLFLPPRQAGQPFWEDLLPHDSRAAESQQQSTRRNSVKAAKEKVHPSKRDNMSRKPKDEPIELPTYDPPVLDENIPVFIIHGPPLSGKTTQAKLLSSKFNLPIVNIFELTGNTFTDAHIQNKENDIAQDVALSIGEFTPQEKHLIDAIKECIKNPDFKRGVIFDGLQTEFFEAFSTIKCILFSLGLHPLNESKQTNNISNSATTEHQGMKVWIGNPLVYILIISLDKFSLAQRYARIPETDHSKESNSMLDKTACLLVYPYLSRFPSQEQLELYFQSEELMDGYFHGQQCDSNLESNIKSKLTVFRIIGTQSICEIFEDALKVLPSPDLGIQIPPPRTCQVVKRPVLKQHSVESVSNNLLILTPVQTKEPAPIKKGKDRGKATDSGEKSRTLKGQMQNDHISDVGSVVDDKMSISTKTVGTKKSGGKENPVLSSTHTNHDSSPLSTVPEGFTKQTRWIIQPHSKVNLSLHFWSNAEKELNHTFSFQMVNAPGKAALHCKAICGRPQITCNLKKLPNITDAAKFVNQSLSFKKDNILDFGAILAGVSPEGFPGIQDSEHSLRLIIQNTGLFDLHVDFDTLSNVPSTQKMSKQMPFFLHPSSMDLKVDEQQDLRIYCYPKQDQIGTLEGKLVCKVVNNVDHTSFKLRCISDLPRATIEPSLLNFERIHVGLQESKDITIRNTSALPIHWRLSGLENSTTGISSSETQGILEATCTKKVCISFSSSVEKVIKEQFSFQVFYSKHLEKPALQSTLVVTAEAYMIDVVVKNQNLMEDVPTVGGLNYGILRVAEDSLKSLVLHNKGKYAVLFNFLMKRSLSEIFTVTPVQGKLEPKQDQKVEIHFNKEKKLTKEISLEKVQDFQLCISENHLKCPEQKIVIPISVKAVYSKFLLVPEQGIHFGSQVCGTTSVPQILLIHNVGHSPFSFKLSSAEVSEADEGAMKISKEESVAKKVSEKANDGGKGADSKKNAAEKSKKLHEKMPLAAKPDVLELKHFKLSPSCGIVSPNEKQEVTIYFKAEAIGAVSESVRVNISDRDPFVHAEEPIYSFYGDCCMPGIDTSPETIFEESHVLDRVNCDNIPPKGTYCIRQSIFSFGPVVIASPISKNTTSKPGGRIAEARLRIENPFKVPCSLQFMISPYQQGQDAASFSVSPKALEIPPLEYTFVTCSFLPMALKRYSSLLDIMLIIRGQTHGSLFRCELIGEGTLPTLDIECLTLLSPSKIPWLKFSRLLKGKSKSLPVVLRNKGLVAVTGKIKVHGNDESWLSLARVQNGFDELLDFESYFSIPVGGMEKILVTFSPQDVKSYKEEVQILIDENPSEKRSIQITGEGYDEDLVFTGLPMDSDNELYFDDCPVGSKKLLEFSMFNKATDKHYYYEWPGVSCLTFSPGSGYVLAGQVQSIQATFSPTKPVQYVDYEIKLQVCNVKYEDPEVEQQDENVTKKSDKKTQSKTPKESHYEIIKNSNRVILVKIHAVADNIRYDCLVQEINFKTTMMFQKRTFSFTLKNLSSITMPFTWTVQNLDGNSLTQDIYVISPISGSIPAKESANINVRFCPVEVEEYNYILYCDIHNLDPSSSPPKIALNGKVARPWCYFELTRSSYPIKAQNPEQDVIDPNTNVIEFDSLGSNMHGIKYFVAVNTTKKAYKFIWEKRPTQTHHVSGELISSFSKAKNTDDPFKCLTTTGEIMGGKKYEMAFQYILPRVEHHECLWTFRIPEHEIEVPFLLVSNIKKPALYFDKAIINFGPVLVGSLVKHTVHLLNDEPMPFFVCFSKQDYNEIQSNNQSSIRIKPRSAIIKPASRLAIEISFSPVSEGRVSVKTRCNIKKFNPLFISVKGEAYQYHEEIYMDAEDGGPPVKLSSKEVYCLRTQQEQTKTENYVKRITISNNGKFTFQFLWEWSPNATVWVEPAGGSLARDEKLSCEISIPIVKKREESNTILTCQIMHGKAYHIKIPGSLSEEEQERKLTRE
ncbi:hypothetical protein KP509_02G000200 [Ceratopteris richardii]|uniref:HYDIN/VesB/CFA65-like Ig-like domain-containing protein n=1 Tax=Ceratopteris richardii TaxID=49495 RepID=A0A8T2VAG4_CERRI|nr:hypothetical protein KP509_02G000200 [Ceratopteris richardii]